MEDFDSVAYGVGSFGARAEATLMRLLLEREGGLVAIVTLQLLSLNAKKHSEPRWLLGEQGPQLQLAALC